CIQLGHHGNIGRTIMEWEKNGWKLHTYQAQGTPTLVNHYLLFERETEKKPLTMQAAATTV
ncbi:hypothetical protein MUP77_07205, partial [Candidatus Bathyarchaeota archaeon]|nr:hypothetical protein [Candidatus Bathyarchaeota archaeon]